MNAEMLMAQMAAQMEQQQIMNQQLLAVIQHLQDQPPLPPPPPPARAAPVARDARVKVAAPDRFDGNRTKLRGFFAQVQLNFEANPAAFEEDRRKTTFVGSYLGGTALEWFTQLLENADEILDDYELFVERLKQMFGDADEARRCVPSRPSRSWPRG